MHFKNIAICEGGATDSYVDMPEVALDINDPEFAAKAGAFMAATPGPAPMVVIRRAVQGPISVGMDPGTGPWRSPVSGSQSTVNLVSLEI